MVVVAILIRAAVPRYTYAPMPSRPQYSVRTDRWTGEAAVGVIADNGWRPVTPPPLPAPQKPQVGDQPGTMPDLDLRGIPKKAK